MDRPMAANLEPASADYERYQVHSPVEIVSLLRGVVDSHALVTIFFNHGGDFIVTSLLSVNTEFNELVFDLGADRDANVHLLRSQRLNIVTYLDHVKLQFSSGSASQIVFDEMPALRIRIPESVLRLQRRNFYRLKTPVAKPLLVNLPHPVMIGDRLELRVLDLSCGGVAILVPELLTADVGTLLADCRIELPDFGPLKVSLEVRNSAIVPDAGGKKMRRLGCQFVDLPGPMVTQVQRYINKIERTRAAMSAGVARNSA